MSPFSGEYYRYSYAVTTSLFTFRRTPLTSQEQSAGENLAKNVNDTDSKLKFFFRAKTSISTHKKILAKLIDHSGINKLKILIQTLFQYLLPPILR